MTESLHKKVSITCASKVGKKVPPDWNCINRAQRGQAASALPRSCSTKCRSFEADCSDSDLTVTGANTDEQRETCTLRNMLSFTGVLSFGTCANICEIVAPLSHGGGREFKSPRVHF